MAPPQSQKQRSRTGCLPCRKRRKKCDEQLPVCARCTRTGSQCLWLLPSQQVLGLYLSLVEQQLEPVSVDSSRVEASSSSSSSRHDCDSIQLAATGGFYSEIWASAQQAHLEYHGIEGLSLLESLASDSLQDYQLQFIADKHVGAEALSDFINNVSPPINKWDYARDYGPTIPWITENTEFNTDFDPDDAMPLIRRSIAMLDAIKEPVFVEVENFYLAFFARYYYDYASITDLIIIRARERFATSDCLKHGMLGTAVLFRANYENSGLAVSLRDHARELHSLAAKTLQADLDNQMVSPWVKLSGAMELVNHEYYAGNLSSYYHHLNQAASLVRVVLNSNSMDFLNLSGEHTFDIRLFAWCDIMGSMALSRPTLLDYESDVSGLSQHNTAGEHHAHPDKGVEWIFGCPDVLAVLLARTSSLRHADIPTQERMTHGKEIEHLIRHSQFRLVRAKSPMMRVARLAAQELWRHAAILYIHHAIFKSSHDDSVIQDSVKQIIKIAATLKVGVNPDCFLSVPYFIAGFFAISEKHRHILRSRVLSCGNERFLRHLAEALDDLWKESDTNGGLTSWSGNHPPKFIF